MYEMDETGTKFLLDEEKKRIPVLANMWTDFVTKKTGMSGYNAIFSAGMPSMTNMRAMIDTILAQGGGIRSTGSAEKGDLKCISIFYARDLILEMCFSELSLQQELLLV